MYPPLDLHEDNLGMPPRLEEGSRGKRDSGAECSRGSCLFWDIIALFLKQSVDHNWVAFIFCGRAEVGLTDRASLLLPSDPPTYSEARVLQLFLFLDFIKIRLAG